MMQIDGIRLIAGLLFSFWIFVPGAWSEARAEPPRAVSSLAELYAALAQARGGETILLAGGSYGAFVLGRKSGFDITFPATVTIASADPGNPAVFSRVDVRDAANLTFDRVTFDYTFTPGEKIFYRPFQFNGCENITIRNSTFDGDVAKGVSPEADGLGYAFGLVVGDSSGVTVENNEIFNFFRGTVMGGNRDTTIRGNELYALRMDGMNFVQMQDVVIEGNYIHDFVRSALVTDHADMIQFWTNGSEMPSTDIVIRGNVLMAGLGNATQSIFMRNDLVDRGLAGSEMFYRNVLIEDNVIVNGHTHGITLGETDNATIRRNTLLRNQSAAQGENRQKKVRIPRIAIKSASRGVVIEENLAAAFPADQPGWVIRGNLPVQDISPMQPGYYQKIFVAAIAGDQRLLDNFSYLPGGAADKLGLGAEILRPGVDRSRFAPRRRVVRSGRQPIARRHGGFLRCPCMSTLVGVRRVSGTRPLSELSVVPE